MTKRIRSLLQIWWRMATLECHIVVALPICHLKDFIACHRIDLYTVISIKKEKGSEHPPDKLCALNPIKKHVHYNRLCPFTQWCRWFFYVKSNDVVPPCPVCHGCMRYRDSKKRGMKLEGGSRQWLIIHRFKCCSCGRLHNELPDSLGLKS